MRQLIFGLVLLLAVLFTINHFTQVEDILDVLQHSDWRFFLLAVAVEGLWIMAYAATFFAVFRALGIRRRLLPLIPLAVATNFVNVIAPAAGMSGLAYLVSEARRNHFSSAHTTVAGALVVLADYCGFAFFLVLGLFVLFRRGDLSATEIFASGLLFSMGVVLAALLYLGMKSARALGRALRWMAHSVNQILHPFIRRDYLSEEHAEHFAHDAAEGLSQVRRQPKKLLLPLLFSVLAKAILLSVLMLMFLAFRVPLSLGTLVAAFAIGYLFFIISPTPAGIGMVEGLLTLSLTSMFVPVDQAAVVVLGYRAVTFWLPLFLGMLSFQLLHLKKPIVTEEPSSAPQTN